MSKVKNRIKVLSLIKFNNDKNEQCLATFKTDMDLKLSELTKFPYDYTIVSRYFGAAKDVDEKFDTMKQEYNKYEYTVDKRIVKSLSKNIFIFKEKVIKNE